MIIHWILYDINSAGLYMVVDRPLNEWMASNILALKAIRPEK